MSVGETTATVVSWLSSVGPVFGLDTILHADPFQCSINVRLPFVPVLDIPTAHTFLRVTAATLLRTFTLPAVFGLEETLQAVPFQCSMRVCEVLELEV
jgi:hypothetical protein